MTSFTGGKTLNFQEVKEAEAISINVSQMSKTVLSQSIYFKDTMTGINFSSSFKTHEYTRNSLWDYKSYTCYGFKISKKQRLKESGFIFNPFDTKSRIEYVDKVITKLENQLKLLS